MKFVILMSILICQIISCNQSQAIKELDKYDSSKIYIYQYPKLLENYTIEIFNFDSIRNRKITNETLFTYNTIKFQFIFRKTNNYEFVNEIKINDSLVKLSTEDSFLTVFNEIKLIKYGGYIYIVLCLVSPDYDYGSEVNTFEINKYIRLKDSEIECIDLLNFNVNSHLNLIFDSNNDSILEFGEVDQEFDLTEQKKNEFENKGIKIYNINRMRLKTFNNKENYLLNKNGENVEFWFEFKNDSIKSYLYSNIN